MKCPAPAATRCSGSPATEEFNATDRQQEITGGSTTTYTIPSLAPGTEYTVQVSATKANARVDGAPSAPVTATPKAVSPGQVTGVALTPAAEALQVTWRSGGDSGRLPGAVEVRHGRE